MAISTFTNSLASLFQIIKQSFYCKNLYQKVIENWSGYGIKYFLTMILLVNLPVILILSTVYYDIFQIINNVVKIDKALVEDSPANEKTIKYAEYIIDLLNQLPESAIVSGELKINNDIPIVITSKFDPNITLYFDTSSTPNMQNSSLVKFTKRNIIIGDVTLSLMNDFKVGSELNILLSKDNIIKFMEKVSHLFISSILSFLAVIWIMLLVYFIPKIIFNYIVSMLVNTNKKLNLKHRQILRVCLIALTPAVALNALILSISLLFYHNPIANLLLYYRDVAVSLVAISYITYALFPKITIR